MIVQSVKLYNIASEAYTMNHLVVYFKVDVAGAREKGDLNGSPFFVDVSR